jgi:leader peptidase (prepilin peptidase) / N-methyltransferase
MSQETILLLAASIPTGWIVHHAAMRLAVACAPVQAMAGEDFEGDATFLPPLGLAVAATVAVVATAALNAPSAYVLQSVVLGWILVLLALTDLRAFLLPDAVTLPLTAAGVIFTWVFAPERLTDSLIGVAAGYGSFWLIDRVYFVLRGRHGLGLGDAKLLAAAGAWMCWQCLPKVVLIAGAAGLIGYAVASFARRVDAGKPFPFGPALCLGFWLAWLSGDSFVG